MNKILFIISLSVTIASCLTSPIDIQDHVARSKRYSYPLDFIKGDPHGDDILLYNATIKKEKMEGRIVYDDLVFDERMYSNQSLIGLDCPYNITAISILHQDLYETSGYPMLLLGDVGAPEVVFLFVSQKDQGINFWVRIWGRPAETSDAKYNLIQGVPSAEDELLLFTNIIQTGQMGNSVNGIVVYEKPANKSVTITSIQAWDISVGCKLGGFPSVVSGGVGEDHAKIEISSQKFKGFQYHVLVYGNIQNENKN